MKKHDLQSYLDSLQDPKELEKIGNEVIRRAVYQAILERFGDSEGPVHRRKDHQVTTVIKKGDFVPEHLRKLPKMQVNEAGHSEAAWKDCWPECWGDMSWGMDCYSDCYTDYMLYCCSPDRLREVVAEKPLERIQEYLRQLPLEEEFSKAEIEILKEFDII